MNDKHPAPHGRHGILVSDFDGTMTRFDFYDLVCKAFPAILAAGYWQQYEAGTLTHFEALRNIFATIRAEEAQMKDIIRSMEIDAHLPSSVGKLHLRGWETVVASAGCAWYIKQLLNHSGVHLEVNANPGVFAPDTGLVMTLPADSPYCSPEFGINKTAVVKDALRRSPHVAFAGDGRPDLAPALLVPPRRRFAKHWLAKKLVEIGEEFRPFETWSDIAHAIAQDERS